MRSLAGSLADNQERVLRPHDVLAKALEQKQDNSDRRVMELSRERLSQAIDREAKGLIRLYDFSDDATVSLLSESENKVYLVRGVASFGDQTFDSFGASQAGPRDAGIESVCP